MARLMTKARLPVFFSMPATTLRSPVLSLPIPSGKNGATARAGSMKRLVTMKRSCRICGCITLTTRVQYLRSQSAQAPRRHPSLADPHHRRHARLGAHHRHSARDDPRPVFVPAWGGANVIYAVVQTDGYARRISASRGQRSESTGISFQDVGGQWIADRHIPEKRKSS